MALERSVRLEPGCGQQEQFRVRIGAGEQQPDAPCVAQDDGADPQQLQAQGAALRARQRGTAKRRVADRLQQRVDQARQQQA